MTKIGKSGYLVGDFSNFVYNLESVWFFCYNIFELK